MRVLKFLEHCHQAYCLIIQTDQSTRQDTDYVHSHRRLPQSFPALLKAILSEFWTQFLRLDWFHSSEKYHAFHSEQLFSFEMTNVWHSLTRRLVLASCKDISDSFPKVEEEGGSSPFASKHWAVTRLECHCDSWSLEEGRRRQLELISSKAHPSLKSWDQVFWEPCCHHHFDCCHPPTHSGLLRPSPTDFPAVPSFIQLLLNTGTIHQMCFHLCLLKSSMAPFGQPHPFHPLLSEVSWSIYILTPNSFFTCSNSISRCQSNLCLGEKDTVLISSSNPFSSPRIFSAFPLPTLPYPFFFRPTSILFQYQELYELLPPKHKSSLCFLLIFYSCRKAMGTPKWTRNRPVSREGGSQNQLPCVTIRFVNTRFHNGLCSWLQELILSVSWRVHRELFEHCFQKTGGKQQFLAWLRCLGLPILNLPHIRSDTHTHPHNLPIIWISSVVQSAQDTWDQTDLE